MCQSRAGRLLSLIALVAIAAGGCAQRRPASSFAELEPRIKPGQKVHVTSTDGSTRTGTLEALSAEGARFRVDGSLTEVLEADAARIAVPEPLWQGAVIGGAIGGLLGATAEQTAEGYGCLLSAAPCDTGNPGRGLLIGAGLGAAIGVGLDALMFRRTTVFTAPGASAVRVRLSPLAARRAGGVRLTIDF